MEKFKQFIKKNRRIVIIAAVALFIVVLVAILASGSYYEPIDDDYFVSDNNKMVLTLSKESSDFESREYESDVTYVVYYYNGDDITDVRIFYSYNNEDEAREANKNITMDGKAWATGRKLNGKYIIFNTNRKSWSGLSVDLLKEALGIDKDADLEQ
ncbi:hypothetical protein IKT18_01620 [Candidatus Saccharibacteria bacterium]|nr:hypothetical protein [Candidatus Saccharibacteria bacterium]